MGEKDRHIVEYQDEYRGAAADKDRSATDARLVRRARAGSQDAFAQLYRTYLPMLFYFIRKHTATDQDAADLVQETFVYVLVKLDELKDPAAFRSWLFRVGLSKALDASRWNARREQNVAFDAPEFDEAATFESLSVLGTGQAAQSPEEAFERAEEQTELLRCLNLLTPVQKDTLILRYYVGFSSAAVADLLGISQDAVRKRLHDASVALRTLMERRPDGAQPTPAPTQSLRKKTLTPAPDKASQALIERLLIEDSQSCTTAGEGAEQMVSPKMSVALSALIAGGGLDAAAQTRVQAFLGSLNKGLPAAPGGETSSAPSAQAQAASASRASLRYTSLGRTALFGIGLVLAYGLGVGSFAAWRALSRPAPDAGQTGQTNVSVPATVTSSQEPTRAATGQDATAAATTDQTQTTTTDKPSNQTDVAASETGARKNATTPVPATPKPRPAPAQIPVISVSQPTLSYPLKTDITAALLIADSKAVARAAGGTSLEVEVSDLSTINTNHAGNYLAFLNARDSQGRKALTQVLLVVIGP